MRELHLSIEVANNGTLLRIHRGESVQKYTFAGTPEATAELLRTITSIVESEHLDGFFPEPWRKHTVRVITEPCPGV